MCIITFRSSFNSVLYSAWFTVGTLMFSKDLQKHLEASISSDECSSLREQHLQRAKAEGKVTQGHVIMTSLAGSLTAQAETIPFPR